MLVNQAIIDRDNDLLPGQHQTITWTNTGTLLIGPLGTNGLQNSDYFVSALVC